MTDAFVRASAWWTVDAGPPHAELLPREQRASAGFSTRILAHVLGRLTAEAPLSALPWVLGCSAAPHDSLRRSLAPAEGWRLVDAGPATVAMTLLEAHACLVEHPHVLVAFAQDATPPYSEAFASALVLSREAESEDGLWLMAPRQHRARPATSRGGEPPSLDAALRLARAADVGRPTVETIPSGSPERPDCWRIELRRAF